MDINTLAYILLGYKKSIVWGGKFFDGCLSTLIYFSLLRVNLSKMDSKYETAAIKFAKLIVSYRKLS